LGLLSRFQASPSPQNKAFTRTVEQTVHETSLKNDGSCVTCREKILAPRLGFEHAFTLWRIGNLELSNVLDLYRVALCYLVLTVGAIGECSRRELTRVSLQSPSICMDRLLKQMGNSPTYGMRKWSSEECGQESAPTCLRLHRKHLR
jgi:hypothetical protein